jgi:hypothetical protein
MAEEKTNAAPDEEYNDDGTKNPNYVAPVKEGEGDTITSEKKEGEGDDVFDDTIDPAKPVEVPVRQFNHQNIIARKNEKIKKLESKLKEGEEGYVPPEDEEEDEDTSLTDAQRGSVEKMVQKTIAPLLGKIASDADNSEFEALVKAEPEAAKYTNHIKAYMAHDAYKGVSPTVIYHHLAWNAAQAIGAKKRKTADFEANLHKGGGNQIIDKGTSSGLPSAEEIAEMDEATFERMESDARQGKFIKR